MNERRFFENEKYWKLWDRKEAMLWLWRMNEMKKEEIGKKRGAQELRRMLYRMELIRLLA